MTAEHSVSAILLMAGKGERFQSQLPKQFHRLAGKALFLHTLERLLASHLFKEIILVCPGDWLDEVHRNLQEIVHAIAIKVVVGGESRRESSLAGLQAIDTKSTHVLIHDGIRPFVSQKILEDNITYAKAFDATDTCIPTSDTIISSYNRTTIDAIPQRSTLMRGQTPQTFSVNLIRRAHQQAILDNFLDVTDDCTLVSRLGAAIHIVAGDEENIKITTEIDLCLAEQILRRQKTHKPVEMEKITGKLFVITGGTGGIGTAIAKTLTDHGAHCITISRTEGLKTCDLSDATTTHEAFNQIYEKHGLIDGLINCAGSLKVSPFLDLSAVQIQKLVEDNLFSTLFSCRYAKIKQQGHIINIASSCYTKGRSGYAVYSATKAAVVNFTQGLADELPQLFINAVAPQRTKTAMRHDNFPGEATHSLLNPDAIAKEVFSILSQRQVSGFVFDIKNK